MKTVKVGIIGGGLMGREAASAFGRWFVFKDMPVKPVLSAVCDLNPDILEWYKQIDSVQTLTTDYNELLKTDVDVVYVAVPHNLHLEIYTKVLEAGKDLLAEKPFGIDLAAAQQIQTKAQELGRFVRCSSEFPFMPGVQRVIEVAQSGKLGTLLQVVSGFHHASDLNPQKPINWKRMVKFCGEIGVMADLGMHVAHVPLRLGWKPSAVFAQLQNVYTTRPDGKGNTVPCDTWDNATIHGTLEAGGQQVPMRWEMKRMAPTETNTWFIEIIGTDGGAKYSTKTPKTLWEYERNGDQVWRQTDLGFTPPFATITGGIFEVGFPDVFQQMLGAYFAERAGELNGRFGCATPEEAVASHVVFAAAQQSHLGQTVVRPEY